MEDIDKVLDRIRQNVKLMKSNDEVIVGVLEIVQQLRSKRFRDWVGDQVLRAAAELSMLMVNLGQMKVEAMLDQDGMYANRKLVQAHKYRAGRGLEGSKIADVERDVLLDTVEEIQVELEANHWAKVLSALYRDVDRIISIAQSYAKYKNMEKATTGLQV